MFELPYFAQSHIQNQLEKHPRKALQQAAIKLSQTYLKGGQNHLQDPLAVVVYLGTRFPATYAAACHVFEQFKAAHPHFSPQHMIDLGAGPGGIALAAQQIFGKVNTTLYEAEVRMRNAGNALFTEGNITVQWQGGFLPQLPKAPEANSRLWSAGYVLNELTPKQRGQFYTNCQEHIKNEDVLVIIEPGTPVGYQHILEAREALLQKNWRMIAPCPHQAACPLTEGDWCHFSERLPRSPMHRLLKGGERNFEDEKFAYLIMAPVASDLQAQKKARLLRQPRQHKGHLQLRLCTDNGVQDPVIGKKNPAYKQLKKADWGEGLDAEMLSRVL